MNRRLILIGIPGALALCAAGYAVFWWIAADRIVAGLERWADERRRDGWTVSFEAPRVGGFPAWIALDVAQPVLEAPVRDGTLHWKGATVRLRARPWRLYRVEFSSPGGHEARHIHLPSRRVFRGWAKDAEGTVRLALDGGPGEVAVRLTTVGLRPGNGSGDILIASVDAVLRAADGAETPQSVTAGFTSITLPPDQKPPLGRKIERIDLSAVLSRPVPPGQLVPSLAAWRDAGGGLRLDNVALSWGPLRVSGEGGFVLDRALQPRGQMTVSAQGYNETIDALARVGQIKPREVIGARLVLGLLARPGPGGGPLRVTLPLTIQDGVVTAGPRRIARFPPINWN